MSIGSIRRADQLIEPARRFQEVLQAGVTAAADGALVTYGIQPRYPATGYGYIKLGDERLVVDGITVNHVDRFVEKPDAITAERYLEESGYRWNSGIFTWRVDVVRSALSEHCPDLSQALQPLGASFGTDSFAAELARVYPGLQKISIDYALMERAEAIDVVTADFDWDDVGSWDALYDHLSADEAGNRVEGEAFLQNCSGCLVVNDDGPLLTGINLQDLTLVARGGAVLAMPRGAGQGVKEMVGRLRQAGREGVL